MSAAVRVGDRAAGVVNVSDPVAAMGRGRGVWVGAAAGAVRVAAAVAVGMAVGKTGLGHGVAEAGGRVTVGKGAGVAEETGVPQADSSSPEAAIQPVSACSTRASFIAGRIVGEGGPGVNPAVNEYAMRRPCAWFLFFAA
jgi:hypothetical protein